MIRLAHAAVLATLVLAAAPAAGQCRFLDTGEDGISAAYHQATVESRLEMTGVSLSRAHGGRLAYGLRLERLEQIPGRGPDIHGTRVMPFASYCLVKQGPQRAHSLELGVRYGHTEFEGDALDRDHARMEEHLVVFTATFSRKAATAFADLVPFVTVSNLLVATELEDHDSRLDLHDHASTLRFGCGLLVADLLYLVPGIDFAEGGTSYAITAGLLVVTSPVSP
jgi:hypothetical protein